MDRPSAVRDGWHSSSARTRADRAGACTCSWRRRSARRRQCTATDAVSQITATAMTPPMAAAVSHATRARLGHVTGDGYASGVGDAIR